MYSTYMEIFIYCIKLHLKIVTILWLNKEQLDWLANATRYMINELQTVANQSVQTWHNQTRRKPDCWMLLINWIIKIVL